MFDAWTNPEVLRRWWAVHPDGSTPVAEVDLRTGGRYRLTMEQPDGSRHTAAASTCEVESPPPAGVQLAVGTRRRRAGPGEHRDGEFHDDGERTRLVLEHTALESSDSRDRHAQGWNACLEIFRSRGFPARSD